MIINRERRALRKILYELFTLRKDKLDGRQNESIWWSFTFSRIISTGRRALKTTSSDFISVLWIIIKIL